MRFADVIAHENVKERLRALVDNGRLPHALLLEGPAGVGKFAMARALSQYIHCENRSGGDSCGVCPACVQHATFNHVDMVYSFPVLKNGRSQAVSDDYVADFREFLTVSPFMNFEEWQKALGNINGQPQMYVEESQDILRKLAFTARASDTKIVLMWLPEKMNTQCANKMLKLIEEPLPGTSLIFVSNNPREILPTIYSRLQRIEMRRLGDDVVAGYLADTLSIPHADALSVAHVALGSILAAEKEAMMSRETEQFLEFFTRLMRLAYQRKIGLLKVWANEVAGLGREQEGRFLEYCQRMVRENFICNLRMPQLNYMNQAEAQFSTRFSPFINERNAERIMSQFNLAQTDIAANGNAKIVLFDLAVKMILLLKQ